MTQGILYLIVFVVLLIVAGLYLGHKLRRRNQKPRAKAAGPSKNGMAPVIMTLKKVLEKRQSEGPKENVSVDGEINALLVDKKKRMFRPMHVDLLPDKNYGRQWEYNQYPALYYLARNPDGSIEPLVPAEILSDSPTELYEAVQTTDDMQEVFGWLDTGSNKSRLFLMVIMAVVTLFIMFMAMTYKKSGNSAAMGIHSIILAWALPGVVLDGPPAADEIDPELKKKLKSILEQDPMSTAFTQQHISSAIEKFVDRGERVEDLWLRSHFRDVNHMNACIRLYRKARHFEDLELQEMILNHMAAYPSIGGMRIDILLQAVTGMLHEKNGRGGGLFSDVKNAMGLGVNNNGNKPGSSN